ncbi:MAG: YihY/virulence factor BrkB family protein [Chitinophagales bacterium]
MSSFFAEIKSFLVELWENYSKDNSLKLGAALAYYTVFSFAPVIIIMISIAGFFFGEEAIRGEVYLELNGLLGDYAALQVQELIENSYVENSSIWVATVGVIGLIFGATAIFGELQDSLNSIWEIRAKPKSNILWFLSTRLLSFGMIVTLGFLLLVSLILNAAMVAFGEKFVQIIPGISDFFLIAVTTLVSLGITTFLFGLMFKVLPDAKIRWRDVWAGAFFTAVLFAIGKHLIGLYIGQSSITTTYGAAGSIAVLLIWTYYSSQILFLGAEFTFVWAKRYGDPIMPNKYAIRVVQQEVVPENQAIGSD